jgi:ferredoxin-NADP reductase
MHTQLLKLQDRLEVAERTLALQFEKPAAFTFKPGQYINLTLLDPPETDAEGNVRIFSVASAVQARFKRSREFSLRAAAPPPAGVSLSKRESFPVVVERG